MSEQGYKTQKDAILFAIEVSKSMLEVPDDSKDGDSATTAALKCAYQLMQQRIISNPNDMMGILLFGTQESKFSEGDGRGFSHCYLLSDLDVPAAEDVKRLRNLVTDEEEAAKLLVPTKCTSDDPGVSMSEVLFCANQIFTTKAPNFGSRRLFLVTDNDDPHSSESEKGVRRSATVRAKDLYDLGVIIELFPISRPDHEFDRANFYDDIVYRPALGDPEAPAPISAPTKASSTADGLTLLQSLLSAINSKATPRRSQFNLPFELGPDLKISVKGYILIKRQERVRSSYIWLSGETPQIAVGSTTRIAEDTARTVEPVEIRKAYKFGGETVTFSKEEQANLRKVFGDPGLRLIGFKSMDLLPTWANLRPPYFVYPSDEGYVGSTRTFAALHASLLKKNKFALCWVIPRRNASPVLAALFPSAEKVDEQTKEQLMPAGLWMSPLPYADDVRKLPDIGPSGQLVAPDSLIDKMRVIVQQLQLPKAMYDPSRYPNPSLQWFYRILQAMALEEDIPEKAEDKTVPRYRQIDKRAGDYVVEWGQELDQQYLAWKGDHSSEKKRSAPAATAGPALKRVKREDDDAGGVLGDDVVKDAVKTKRTKHLTNPQLKEWLKSKGLDTSGKKADLMERVEDYFS